MSVESLGAEVPAIERQLKTLLVSRLKEVCRSEGLGVSGNKTDLQRKLLERLDNLRYTCDVEAFYELKDLIMPGPKPFSGSTQTKTSPYVPQGGLFPSLPSSSSYSLHANGSSSYSASHSKTSNLTFTQSPFYIINAPLTSVHDLPVMHANRHTVQAQFVLGIENHDRLRQPQSNLRILVYCASDIGYQQRSDVAFPSQIELKVNGEPFVGNLRGIKKKPGTTRPADITNLVRKLPNYSNSVSITYAATDKVYTPDTRFAFVVNLVTKRSVEELVLKIKAANVISKQQVINEMLSKANDPDIVTTSTVMSLKCPLSAMRMTLPCRSTICSHNQCFDATSFLQLQEQAPQWSCPICNKVFAFHNLAVDQYVQDILDTTPKSIDQVTIEPDGTCRQADGNGIDTSFRKPVVASGGDSRKQAWDGDDIIEIQDHRAISSLKAEEASAAASSPQSWTRTPTMSSREPSTAASSVARSTGSKRPAEVIDLTLSSDEEEEPIRRPVKRQSVASFQGSSSFNGSVSSSTGIAPARLDTSSAAPSRASAGFSPTASASSPSIPGLRPPPRPSQQQPPPHQSWSPSLGSYGSPQSPSTLGPPPPSYSGYNSWAPR